MFLKMTLPNTPRAELDELVAISIMRNDAVFEVIYVQF